jgi:putative redox protein
VVAVATIATPSDTRHLSETLLRRAPDLLEAGEAEVDVGGKIVRVRRELLDDLEKHDLPRLAQSLGRALLVFHSPEDRAVGIDHAAALFRAARHPKSFVALDGADHLLMARERDARFVAGVFAAWAERYLDDPTDESAG